MCIGFVRPSRDNWRTIVFFCGGEGCLYRGKESVLCQRQGLVIRYHTTCMGTAGTVGMTAAEESRAAAEGLRAAAEEGTETPKPDPEPEVEAHTWRFIPAKLFTLHSREHQAALHFPHLGKSFPTSEHTAQRTDCLSKRDDRSTAARAGWSGGIAPLLLVLLLALGLGLLGLLRMLG